MATGEDQMAEYRNARHISQVLKAEGDAIPEWQPGMHDPEVQRDIYHQLADMDGLAEDPDILGILERSRSPQRHSNRNHRWLAMVACLLVAMGIWWGSDLLSDGGVDGVGKMDRYVSRVGEQRTFELADGSTMTLNTGSEALVQIGSDARIVTLKRGEAFFDVVKDPSRRFGVEVGGQVVSVLGTSFNVLKTRNGLALTVEDGLVQLHPISESLQPQAEAASKSGMLPSRQWKVAAGWRVTVAGKIMQSQSVAESQVAGWRSGMLNFIGAPLVDVVKELNRYSVKKILIEDSTIVDKRINASLRVNGLNEGLKAVGGAYGLDVVEEFDHISITKK